MKNLLLFSIMLFTASASFAQLTVKPNGAADSYVYVKDQILYVNNDVNLTKNPNSTVEASIYLRDNGQLIQGGTTSTNDGDGFLSVQQNTPVTNAWAYYYWCSPVGNPVPVGGGPAYGMGNTNFGLASIYEDTNTLAGTGTEALQSLNVSTKEGYTDPRLTISRRWMYIHEIPSDEAEANYHRINASNGAPAGFGFTMKGVSKGPLSLIAKSSHDQLYEFRGRPNNGDFSIPVLGPVESVAQMTLTGNPYPSALDLNKIFYEAGNGALSQIYFYDEDRSKYTHNYSGKPFGYGVWIPVLPDNTPNDPTDFIGAYTAATFYIWNASGNHGGTGPAGTNANDKRYAPVGQGFMFVGNAGGNVAIKNSHRVFIKEGTANHSVFQRPENNENEDAVTENTVNGPTTAVITTADNRIPQMRLYVVFDDALTRDMLLIFSDQATDGYDRGMDGLSPMGMAADAYFPIGDDNNRLPYVINSVNYQLEKQIPFAFKLNKATNIKVLVKEEVKKPYERAYLFDSQENTYQNLSLSGAKPTSINLPAGTYNNRFFIVFKNPNVKRDIPESELQAEALVRGNIDFFQNNPDHQLEVRNPEGYTLKSAAVYDMAGKLVISESNLGDDNKYTFYTGNLSDGVYLVKLITSDEISVDYKVVVHNQ